MVERIERRISPEGKLRADGFKRVGTTVFIRSLDGKYLLAKENSKDIDTGKEVGVWSFPSEKSKKGETFLATAIRGLVEEFSPEILEQLSLDKKCFVGEAGVVSIKARMISLTFGGDSAQFIIISPEISDFRWFTAEEILNGNYHFRSGIKEIFAECLSRGLLPETKFDLRRSLKTLSQRLIMVPEDTSDIAL